MESAEQDILAALQDAYEMMYEKKDSTRWRRHILDIEEKKCKKKKSSKNTTVIVVGGYYGGHGHGGSRWWRR